MLFAITGFTLNHAADIEAHPKTSQKTGQVPADLLKNLSDEVGKRSKKNADTRLPSALLQWLETHHKIDASDKGAEWSPEELYVALPRPGGDAWLRINLEDGAFEYEKTERGVIAYLNDLHKGRNTGKAWSWFIDIFAVACLVFCITGLFLLKMHANNRRLTWPLVAAGLVIPMLLSIMVIH